MRKLDWPDRIFDAWIAFEADDVVAVGGGAGGSTGTSSLDSFYEACSRVGKQRRVVDARRAKDMVAQEEWGQWQQERKPKRKDQQKEKKEKKKEKPQKKQKEKEPPSTKAVAKPDVTADNKKKRTFDQAADVEAQAVGSEGNVEAQSGGSGDVGEGPSVKKAKTANPMDDYVVIDNLMAGNMIHIANLGPEFNAEAIRLLCEDVGQVVDVIVTPNAETGTAEALVEFADVEQVKQAVVIMDGLPYGASAEGGEAGPVKVQRCRPKQKIWNFGDREERNKIYVSGLLPNIKKAVLRDLFGKFGALKEVRLVNRKTMSFAYVEYEDEESARKSLELNGTEIEPGRTVSVAISNPSKKSAPPPKQVDKRELYVSNLPPQVGVDELKAMFGKFGEVTDVRLVHLPNGQSKGVAFVDFVEEAHAHEALVTLNGTELNGRFIVVSISDPNVRHKKRTEGYEDPGRRNDRGGGSGRGRPGLGYSKKNKKQEKQEDTLHGQDPKGSDTGLMGPPPTMLVPRSARRPVSNTSQPHRKKFIAASVGPKTAGAASTADKMDIDEARPQQSDDGAKTTTSGGSGGGGKTQDDFRKMLMGGR
ncbi:Splicing factor [Quaeritorhiza haematococci]|nr:Splicing factor [Quaeritorhiza haematococci]